MVSWAQSSELACQSSDCHTGFGLRRGAPGPCLLLDGVDSSFRLVPVNHRGCIEVIAREMGNQAWSELAILCHGAAGKLNIGRSEINTSVLLKRREELETLNINTLSLYSCNTGCDSNFLQTLSNIMGTHVFASSTQVGAQSKGGSWELGVHATPSNLFSSSIPEWNHVLSTITISAHDLMNQFNNFWFDKVEDMMMDYYLMHIDDPDVIEGYRLHGQTDWKDLFLHHYLPDEGNNKNDIHIDFSGLTFIGCLDDKYEGGYLSFPKQNYKIKLGRRDLIIFPGNFTHPHGVSPILSGDRKVVVGQSLGPKQLHKFGKEI